ncbi:MAG: HAMP domain-containing histidine kinase [Anaerolineae bacterium]|nr:HAMP domain-containing histidine kinase [Anaerolineae bacterium]
MQLQTAIHAKDEMIQNVSHELRTPLTHIKGYTELLIDGVLGELNEDQYQAMATVNKKADALARLVNGLLTLQTFSAEELELGPVNVSTLLKELADDWGVRLADGPVQVEIIPTAAHLRAHADAERLREAMDQLIDNALKFSPNGGVIRLEAEDKGEMVRLAVSDSGIGIPPDKLSAVFERFYQVDGSSKRRYGGAGIGLSLVQKIVEAHQGEVWVESPGWLGQGTTFVIEVPAANGVGPEEG